MSKNEKTRTERQVFIASPGDVPEERNIARQICDDLNKGNFIADYGILLKAVGWEDAFPAAGRPQDIINSLAEECDVFICIFHKRFGSHTGKVESGTLEEFLNAYESWKSCKKPHIMFYFKKAGIHSLEELDDPQLREVLSLKKKIEENKILLFKEFSSPTEFQTLLRDHLERWIVSHCQKTGKEEVKPWEKAVREDAAWMKYLDSALAEHRYLPTQGFETTLRVPIELERTYVNMRAQVHLKDYEFNLKGRERMKKTAVREQLSSLDIKAAFKALDNRNLKNMVILGDPGSGKTTLLKHILIVLAHGRGEEKLALEKCPVPFFTALRDLKEPDQTELPAFIHRVCRLGDFGITGKKAEELLDQGAAVVLLDGLDEVADIKSREKTTRWVDRAGKRFPKSRFVMTSRFSGYLGKSRLEGNAMELSIQDFLPHEVKEFLLNWFEAVETALHPSEEEEKWKRKGREEATILYKRSLLQKYLYETEYMLRY